MQVVLQYKSPNAILKEQISTRRHARFCIQSTNNWPWQLVNTWNFKEMKCCLKSKEWKRWIIVKCLLVQQSLWRLFYSDLSPVSYHLWFRPHSGGALWPGPAINKNIDSLGEIWMHICINLYFNVRYRVVIKEVLRHSLYKESSSSQ